MIILWSHRRLNQTLLEFLASFSSWPVHNDGRGIYSFGILPKNTNFKLDLIQSESQAAPTCTFSSLTSFKDGDVVATRTQGPGDGCDA